MRTAFAVLAALVLAPTLARADAPQPTHVNEGVYDHPDQPDQPSGYFGFGAAAATPGFGGAAIEAGVRLGETSLWLHGTAADLDYLLVVLRGGLEERLCMNPLNTTCALFGADVGEVDGANLVSPRVGLDMNVGGEVHFRPGVEAEVVEGDFFGFGATLMVAIEH